MNPFFCLLLVSFLVKASHFDEKQYMTDAIKLACLQNFNVIEQNIYDAISKSKWDFSWCQTNDELLESIFEDLPKINLLFKPATGMMPRYVWDLKNVMGTMLEKYFLPMNFSDLETVDSYEHLKSVCEKLFSQILSHNLSLGNTVKEGMFRLFYLYISFQHIYPQKQAFDLNNTLHDPMNMQRPKRFKKGESNFSDSRSIGTFSNSSSIYRPPTTATSTNTNNIFKVITAQTANNSEQLWPSDQQFNGLSDFPSPHFACIKLPSMQASSGRTFPEISRSIDDRSQRSNVGGIVPNSIVNSTLTERTRPFLLACIITSTGEHLSPVSVRTSKTRYLRKRQIKDVYNTEYQGCFQINPPNQSDQSPTGPNQSDQNQQEKQSQLPQINTQVPPSILMTQQPVALLIQQDQQVHQLHPQFPQLSIVIPIPVRPQTINRHSN